MRTQSEHGDAGRLSRLQYCFDDFIFLSDQHTITFPSRDAERNLKLFLFSSEFSDTVNLALSRTYRQMRACVREHTHTHTCQQSLAETKCCVLLNIYMHYLSFSVNKVLKEGFVLGMLHVSCFINQSPLHVVQSNNVHDFEQILNIYKEMEIK